MTVEEYLAIPYVMLVESVELADGTWLRRATYPELPGCEARALSPLDAMDQLEAAKVAFILDRLNRGEPVPVPRSPLRGAATEAPVEQAL